MKISQWPKMERPRERLLAMGASNLSDAELLAIFLGSGVKGMNAIDLARQLLKDHGDIKTILTLSKKEFCRLKGLGEVKYILLQAATELSRRTFLEEISSDIVLSNSACVEKFLVSTLGNLQEEVFACLLLNSNLRLIKYVEVCRGSVNQAMIYPRQIVKLAMDHGASSIIFAHNHPSNVLKASPEDLALTKHMKKVLELVDVVLLDHVIVGRNSLASVM